MSTGHGEIMPEQSLKGIHSEPHRKHATTRLGVGAALICLAAMLAGGLAIYAHLDSAGAVDTSQESHLHVLLVDPADPHHILLGQHSGLVESHDGGATWSLAQG